MTKKTYSPFSHQRLDVYRLALEFAKWVHQQTMLPYHLKVQLSKASDSIVLNLAEGASQLSSPMAKKHYRIAYCSAAESSSAIDLSRFRKARNIDEGIELINRIGMMLIRLMKA